MVKNGDTEAFSIIVKKYQHNLLNFIYKLVNNRDIVEDIGQEVFLRVYKSIHKFNPKRGTPFSAWLFIIARNYCINEIRKYSKIKNISLNEYATLTFPDKTNDDILIYKQQQEALESSLKQLPEPFKSAILKSLEGKSLNEIANDEGVPLGTIKSRLYRAKHKISIFIQKYLGDRDYDRI